jgi:predicted transposase/invertase (TIGR01784 family)
LQIGSGKVCACEVSPRKTWKFALMRQLYDRGMSSQDIRNLYNFIDWTMMLPEDLDMAFWQELKTFEEDQQMAYVTSAERFGRKIGVEEGLKKGLEKGLKKGEIQKAQKVALKMLQEGFDRDTICRLTELSIASWKPWPLRMRRLFADQRQ